MCCIKALSQFLIFASFPFVVFTSSFISSFDVCMLLIPLLKIFCTIHFHPAFPFFEEYLFPVPDFASTLYSSVRA